MSENANLIGTLSPLAWLLIVAAVIVVLMIVYVVLVRRRPRDDDGPVGRPAERKTRQLEPPGIDPRGAARDEPFVRVAVLPAAPTLRSGGPPGATALDPGSEPEPMATPGPKSEAVAADDLSLLKGVGPKLVGLLIGLGITRFDQIAAWDDADITRIDDQLGAFKGRIARDNWVDQARLLAAGDRNVFEARYGAIQN